MNVSQADQKRKKKSCFDVSSPFLHDNNEPFIDHAMKSGHLITGDDQLSGWIEKKHQSTPKSLLMVIAAMKLKDAYSLEGTL